MTVRSKGTLLGAVVLAGALGVGGCASQPTAVVYVPTGPPVSVREVVTFRPGPDYVWVSGYHRWDGHHYVWVGGRWDHGPRPHAHWVAGHWRHNSHGYYWVDGRWR